MEVRRVVGLLGLAVVSWVAVGCGDESATSSTTADAIASGTTAFVTAPPVTTPPATPTAPSTTEVRTPDTTAMSIDVEGSGVGFGWSGDYVGEPLAEVAGRTTPDGIVVHVQQMPDWEQGPAAPSSNWSPASWCKPVGTLRVAMRLGDAIAIGQGGRYTDPFGGVNASTFTGGYAEGTLFTVVVLQVDAATTEVSAQFAGGQTDTTRPVDGYAILAAPTAPAARMDAPPEPPVIGIGITRAGTTTDYPAGELPQPTLAERASGCNPPTALPEPGVQPDDPAAAEQLVRDVFDIAFADDGSGGWQTTLDSTEGIQDALDQLQQGPYQDAAGSADHAMNDLVFTSPTEAWFTYDLFANGNDFDDRFGTATLIDGEWKIARAVLCQDLQLAGISCVPATAQLYPPQS